MGTSTIESEGGDLGVGDFILLSEITMDAFVENLKIRFDWIVDEIFEKKFVILVLRKDEFIHILAKFVN
jgi:hypothetical protein